MGFASIDDLVGELTGQGKHWRADFVKAYASSGGAGTAGRWYDLQYFDGNPSKNYAPGNYIRNGDFLGGTMGWTVGSSYWAFTPATHLMTRTANADVSTLSQNTSCVNGTSYSVVYTITRTAGGVTISLGGTAGTQRTAAGTYRETIVCGSDTNAPLVITPDATFAGTVDVVAVTQDLAFTPYTDTTVDNVLWHGGNVSGDTKHAVNVGAWTQGSTGAPSVLQIVDLLGVYPRIQTNLATLQTLSNTQTLPRYTDGKGVRAYFAINTTNGANAQNFVMSYTNQDDVTGRSLGAVVANTASAYQSHIGHSGTGASNFGPFLPLMATDQGIKSVQSCQFSAASASAGFIDLVLCKPILTIPITTAYVAAERNLLTQLPSLPRIYDGAVLGFLVFAGAAIATSVQFQGYIDLAWG